MEFNNEVIALMTDGGYNGIKCDSQEGTQELKQMISDFRGCYFILGYGLCKGYSYEEQWELESQLACPEGRLLSEPENWTGHPNDLLYSHTDHPDLN